MIDLFRPAVERRRRDSVLVDEYVLNDGVPALEPVEYKIHTEFCHWILFEKKITGGPVGLKELDYLYKMGHPDNRQAGFDELYKFYRNEQPLPRPTKRSGVIGYDWEQDSEYIKAAFLQQYGIDLSVTDLHWHDFQGLFYALADTKLNQIMSARYDDSKKGPMLEMRKAWAVEPKRAKRPVMRMV
jgi:hypothetical protein